MAKPFGCGKLIARQRSGRLDLHNDERGTGVRPNDSLAGDVTARVSDT